MAKTQDTCFVLWAERFDEAAAVLFVTEFRKAGLRTSLVRAGGQSDAGANGLALSPDMSIDQACALAHRAVCVVVPCDTPAVQQLRSDPRVGEFLDIAQASQSRLVTGQPADSSINWNQLERFASITRYSGRQNIQRVARRLACQLAGDRSSSQRGRLRVSALKS